VPHDSHRSGSPLDPERSGITIGAEHRRGTGAVGGTRFGDSDISNGLPGPQRYVAPGSRERVIEDKGDVLDDRYRPIRFDDDFDFCVGEVERLGIRRAGREDQEDPRQGDDRAYGSKAVGSLQKRTSGAWSTSSGASKNGFTTKPVNPATRLDGTVWTRLLNVSTASL